MKRLKSVSTPVEGSPEIASDRAALDLLRAQWLAAEATVVPRAVGIDPAELASMVEQSVRHLAPLRAALTTQFGAAAEEALDALPTLARATRQAALEHATAREPRDVRPLEEEVRAIHQLLSSEATVLVLRGLLDASRVASARKGSGRRALVRSTLMFVELLRLTWPRMSGRTAVTLEDLTRAEERAKELDRASRERNDVGVDRQRSAKLRARACSALLEQYGTVRDMVRFIRRRHNDADAIAPSPWSARRLRRRGPRGTADGATRAMPPTDTRSDGVKPEPAVTSVCRADTTAVCAG